MYLLGTDEYIKRIVKQYSQLLLRIAFTRLKSTADAEDLVQEVFLKLLTKKPHFRNEEHEKAWLIRTTINLSCDILKLHTPGSSTWTLYDFETEVTA